MNPTAKHQVDDPADAFEYDEHGCLVSLTPEAFDFFMLAPASAARIAEALRSVRLYEGRVFDVTDDPLVAGKVLATWRTCSLGELPPQPIRDAQIESESRLQASPSQLTLMRAVRRFHGTVERYVAGTVRDRELGRLLEF